MRLKELLEALEDAIKQGRVDPDWHVVIRDTACDYHRFERVDVRRETVAGRHQAIVDLFTR